MERTMDFLEIAERDRIRFIGELQAVNVRIDRNATWDKIRSVLDDVSLLLRTQKKMEAPKSSSWNDLFQLRKKRIALPFSPS